MTAVLLNELSDETYRALERLATEHGRSLESEIRDILDEAVELRTPDRIGSTLAALGRRFGGIDLDPERNKAMAHGVDFDRSFSTPT